MTENTLIDGSVAIGASDAGIYVGQSRNVVIRNSRAEFNVAGIEIENTIGADVHDNVATNNTGGILVFNMPDLKQPGHDTRVFNNQVVANNTKNFGAEGSAVASVPAGSGVVVNSNDNVEIFDNTIGGNNTANVLISSYSACSIPVNESSPRRSTRIPKASSSTATRFRKAAARRIGRRCRRCVRRCSATTGNLPDVVWDGIVNSGQVRRGAVAGCAVDLRRQRRHRTC